MTIFREDDDGKIRLIAITVQSSNEQGKLMGGRVSYLEFQFTTLDVMEMTLAEAQTGLYCCFPC